MKRKTLLVNDTSNEMHLGSYQVVKNIKELCAMNGMHVFETLNRKEIKDWPPSVDEKIKQAEVVIINGEGTFHHSSAFLNQLVMRMGSFKDKKMFLINTIWQSMYHKFLKEFLDKFDLITVREGYSYKELNNQYPSKKIMIVPDLILYSEAGNEKISYGDSVMPALKESLKQQKNYSPMNFIDNLPDIQAYVSWLKSSEVHVTGRFHGVCLAILAEVPFLAFNSNSWKIESMLKDMDCSELLIHSFDHIELKKELSKQSLPKVKAYKAQARQKILDSFKRIGEAVK